MFKGSKWPLQLTIVFLILGLLLSLQFRTQRHLINSLETQKTNDLVTMWKNLTTKRTNLQGEIAQLQEQLYELQYRSGPNDSTETSLIKDLDRLRITTGVSPVKGHGITVTITGDSPVMYWDLIDLVNELWVSGAEAIAINNHRVNAYTTITDEEEGHSIYLKVNGDRLLYPIVIKAIGDPHTLEKGLTFTGGLIDNFNNIYQIFPQIRVEQDIQIPAAVLTKWAYAMVDDGQSSEEEQQESQADG